MVDRYQSLIGSQLLSSGQINKNMKVDQIYNINREIVDRTNSHSTKMREYISKYKRNISQDADNFISMFKEQQLKFAKDRTVLKDQLQKLQKNKQKDTPQYNFMKKQLLRAVKSEIDLELQLNQQINKRKEQKQLLKQKLFQGSKQLQNAVKDIQAKRQEILYLQKAINECLQLLEIIGILTNETGQKLDQISQRVKRANIQMEKAEVNIDKAKIAMQKSRCKMCCIIFLALAVIIIILIVIFGFNIVSL